jgi:hypothetical protein
MGFNGFHDRGEDRAVMVMGVRDLYGQRDALTVDHHVALGGRPVASLKPPSINWS